MQEKDFLGSLFDLSFESFVTVKLIRVLYVLALILVVLAAIGILVQSTSQGQLVTGIVGSGTVLFLGILLARVYMEILMVLFRIAENTSVMARYAEQDHERVSSVATTSGE